MKFFWWMAAFALLAAAPAWALNVSALGGLPVLHEGRIKPLESLARLSLGSITAEDKSQLELMAMYLFNPAQALDTPMIAVPSATLRSLLGLPEAKAYRYTEITPRLREKRELLTQLADQNPASYSASERDLWALYQQIDTLTQLSGSFSLILPLNIEISPDIRARYALTQMPPYDYLSLFALSQPLDAAVKALAQQKGSEPEAYTPEEREQALLSMRLSSLAATGAQNHLLRIMPSGWESGEWLSPWALLAQGKGSAQSAALLSHWRSAMLAYGQGNQREFDSAINRLASDLLAQPDVSPYKLRLEQFYYQLNLVDLAMLLYALVLAAALLLPARPILMQGLMIAALSVHAILLMLRVLVLSRPPVSTLYESVLFVALVAAALGFALGKMRLSSPQQGCIIGAGLGAFLLAISGVYAEGGSDPMALPMAVLNTQFWLATHVIVITSGYGASLVAAVMAHLALYRLRSSAQSPKPLVIATLLALLLTSVGTLLGGIWADQSWGRFWGWDPKENGALLLTIWLVWLLHGRMSGHMGQQGFAALLAMTSVVVAVSWFGVNLLGVGLHSYGFTDAAALGLFAFCALECLLIGGLFLRARINKVAL